MAINLLEAAKNMLPGDLISEAAGFLGESEASIQKALNGAIPSVLAGLLGKSSGNAGAGIMDLVKGVAGSGVMNNLPGLFDGSGTSTPGVRTGVSVTVMGWLRSLFGDKVNNVINAISGFAGIKLSSASAVLNMAAPAVLAPVGKYVSENNLSIPDFGALLQTHKSSILSAIPSGFNLTGALGINSLDDIGGKAAESISSGGHYARGRMDDARSSGNKWVWPVLSIAALAALLWFFTQKGCEGTAPAIIEDTTSTKIAPAPLPTVEMTKSPGMLDTVTGNYIYDLGKDTDLKLADGRILKVGENSTEAKLYTMLSDAGWSIDTLDKTKNWVTFDRVYFENGKSVLTDASKAQIKNVAALLKNFPSASIKVGGYTDNTGDEAVNKKVSASTARIVKTELIKSGAAAKQITESIGYGPEHPVCAANDTPACKAQNRRVDLKVASK